MSNPIREAPAGPRRACGEKIAEPDEGFCSSAGRYSRPGVVSPAEEAHLKFVNTVTIAMGVAHAAIRLCPCSIVQSGAYGTGFEVL